MGRRSSQRHYMETISGEATWRVAGVHSSCTSMIMMSVSYSADDYGVGIMMYRALCY